MTPRAAAVKTFLRRPLHPRLPVLSVRAALLIVTAGAVWIGYLVDLAARLNGGILYCWTNCPPPLP